VQAVNAKASVEPASTFLGAAIEAYRQMFFILPKDERGGQHLARLLVNMICAKHSAEYDGAAFQ
jgi:hypothetical protein